MSKELKSKINKCPCCSGLDFSECCAKYILDKEIPQTPEQLMRSRYTAYALADIDYVFETMRDFALKDADRAESLKWAKTSRWLGLDILKSSEVKETDTDASVEFVAKFIQDHKQHNLKEHAKFKKYNGRWYYVGDINDVEHGHGCECHPTVTNVQPIRVNKIGRNDPCTCGSGLKYKKCCLA